MPHPKNGASISAEWSTPGLRDKTQVFSMAPAEDYMCLGIVHILHTYIRTHFHAYAHQHTCLCAHTCIHTYTNRGWARCLSRRVSKIHSLSGWGPQHDPKGLPTLSHAIVSGQEQATFLANLKGSFHTPTDPSPRQRKSLQPSFPDWLFLAEMTAGHIPILWEIDPVPRQDDHHKQFPFFP